MDSVPDDDDDGRIFFSFLQEWIEEEVDAAEDQLKEDSASEKSHVEQCSMVQTCRHMLGKKPSLVEPEMTQQKMKILLLVVKRKAQSLEMKMRKMLQALMRLGLSMQKVVPDVSKTPFVDGDFVHYCHRY